MPSDSFDGVTGQIWAGLVLVAWLTMSARVVKRTPFAAWFAIERAALVYAIAMAGLTSSTLLLGRIGGLGYYGGATGGAALAIWISWMLRRPDPASHDRDPGDRPLPRFEGRGAWWALLSIGSLPAVLIAVLCHGVDPGVHHWNMRAIQRDLLPLPHPSYPGFEIPYHYAIDLMAATWGRLVPIDPEWIFDGLSVFAWVASVVLGARLVLALDGISRVRALGYAVAFAFLGGGLMWAFFPLATNIGTPAQALAGFSPWLFKAGLYGHFTTLSRNLVNLPTLHYFFNMPFAAGLPMGLAFLHVYLVWTEARSRIVFGLAVGLLGALGGAHLTVFLVLGLTIGLFGTALVVLPSMHESPAWSMPRWRLMRGTMVLGLAAGMLGILQGGVFAALQGGSVGGPYQYFAGLGVGFGSALLYYLVTFGVPGVLGIVGGARGLRNGSHASLLLVLIAGIGFAAPQLVWATASPIDNLKFFTLACIALGLLAGPGMEVVLARLPAAAKPATACLLIGMSLATPLLHTAARLVSAPAYRLSVQARMAFDEPRIQPLPSELHPAEFVASRWLRQHMGERDLLLLLPPRPNVPGTAATELDIHAMTGVFLAAPSHPGYPGIRVPQPISGDRTDLYRRAVALRAEGLCGLAPLWIYVRESLLPPGRVEPIRRAVERGLLREAQAWKSDDGRHVIYEACPHPAER